MVARTSNWNVLEGCSRRIGRKADHTGRAGIHLVEEVQRSPHALVGRNLVGHLHTEGLVELGHSLADHIGLEVDSLAGRSPVGHNPAGRTGCRGLT